MTIDEINIAIDSTLDDIVGDIQQGMLTKNRNASYKLVNNLETYTSNGMGILYAPNYIKYIETGSSPGPRGGWFFSKIKQWTIDKGIATNSNANKIGGAIAKHIIDNGTAIYPKGENVFTQEIKKTFDNLPSKIINNLNIWE